MMIHAGIYCVEDDHDWNGVIKVYYYEDEDDIDDENKVLEVVREDDDDAHFVNPGGDDE